MESNEGADVPLESSWLDRAIRWEWQLMHVVHKEEMHTLSVDGALVGQRGGGGLQIYIKQARLWLHLTFFTFTHFAKRTQPRNT